MGLRAHPKVMNKAALVSQRPINPWKRGPPLCHPERSRGICSSTDPTRNVFRPSEAEWRDLLFPAQA